MRANILIGLGTAAVALATIRRRRRIPSSSSLFKSRHQDTNFRRWFRRPPTAQAATQEAECAAHNLAAEILGRPLKRFKYEYLGQLVELGGKFAVSQVMGVRLSGMVAQLLWRGVYLYKLGDNKDRVKVVGDWILDLAWEPEAARIPLGE